MLEALAIFAGIITGILVLVHCFCGGNNYPDARDLRPTPPPRPKRPDARRAPPRPQTLEHCSPVPKLSNDYARVGCPGCGQPHRYGLDREYLDCYACGKTFSPRFEGRKYESYKKKTR